MTAERYPSGQREQTVNLPANAYGGSNPPLSIRAMITHDRMTTRGSSSGGRARAFQARGRGFDSRLPLPLTYDRIPSASNREKPREASPTEARGLGPSEERSARRARAPHGAPGELCRAHVAQAAEHFLGKEEVTGSNPVVGSITRDRRCGI